MAGQPWANEAVSTGGSSSKAPCRKARWAWFAGAIVVVVAAGAVLIILNSGNKTEPQPSPAPKAEGPLDGKLIVTVRKPGSREPLAVNAAGALPVRDGSLMDLEVQLEHPAYVYLVWVGAGGRVVPLYPWNMDEVEVTNLDEPVPDVRTTRVLHSPMTITKGWRFDKKGGLETLFMLARRTPLPKDAQLTKLFAALPHAKARHSEEVAVLQLARGDEAVSTVLAENRGSVAEVREVDAPLLALMMRLRDQFELIHVVRFAHEEE